MSDAVARTDGGAGHASIELSPAVARRARPEPAGALLRSTAKNQG